jgi:hypothetical protein
LPEQTKSKGRREAAFLVSLGSASLGFAGMGLTAIAARQSRTEPNESRAYFNSVLDGVMVADSKG